MNQAFFEYAKNVIDNLTTEEIYEGLVKAGFPVDSITVRQFPELPEEYDPRAAALREVQEELEAGRHVSTLRELQPNQFPFEPIFAG